MIREVAFRRDTEAPKQKRKCSSREANFLCVLEEGIVMARIEQKRQILSRDVDGKGVSMLKDNQETETKHGIAFSELSFTRHSLFSRSRE